MQNEYIVFMVSISIAIILIIATGLHP